MSNSKLSTTDIPESGTGVPKTIQPGNVVFKINFITLKKEPFEGDPYNIVLHCEGEPQPAPFEGFHVDKDRPELGIAKGQVGRIRATEYSFSNRTFSGKEISRDLDMLKWLKNFCASIGAQEWFRAQDKAHETIEDFMAQLEKDRPYEGVWLNSCTAGKEYYNQQGFINYDLYLPWYNAKQVPLEKAGTKESKMIPFAEDIHIKKSKKEKPVEGFTKKAKSGFEI